jgi:RNA polymerase sigma-70 factor (ECF subfamily)
VSDAAFNTLQLQGWLEQIRGGDESARDALVRTVHGRLEVLARRMLRGFPRVARWEQTGDVLQNALLRLLRALQAVTPESTRDFFGLAAQQIRRELLDLAKHYHGKEGLGAHHASHDDLAGAAAGPGADARAVTDLERWTQFHEEVEKLPVEEREVVSLVFYHGWTQAQVAELFHVDERTVRRRWQQALRKLRRLLADGDLAPE